MAASVDSVILELEAKLGSYNSDVANAANATERNLRRINVAANDTEKTMGRQKIGMQQLSYQLGDVAQQFALGVRPQVIFAQQGGQVIQALQLMTGGSSKLASFLGGPWGIALTSALLVLTPFVGKLFEGAEAQKKVELGADALGQAQSVLGGIFDLVTGKIKAQTEALVLNARAQAANLRLEAVKMHDQAFGTFVSAQQPANTFAAQLGGPAVRAQANAGADRVTELLRRVAAGTTTRDQAFKEAQKLDFSGTRVSRQDFLQALVQSSNAQRNTQIADLIDQSLDRGSLAPGLRNAGPKHRERKDRGPTAAETAARADEQLLGITQQILSAREQIATSAQESAELQARNVEWDRRQSIEKIEADKYFTDAQKKELSGAATRLADARLEAIDFHKRQAEERQAQQLAGDRHQAEMDGLQRQYELADTEEARKQLALRILQAEDDFLRSKLHAIEISDTANQDAKDAATLQLQILNASADARRTQVERANETTRERYLREIRQTPAQINEAIDKIKIEGLNSLNDGLTDAIMGAKSLGEVFHDVASQIIGDLLHIAIQQAIIKPLAEALFPGSGSGGRGFLDVLGQAVGLAAGVAGGGKNVANLPKRAMGGPVVAGQTYQVGELGKELFRPNVSGVIIPNDRLSGAGGANGPVVVHLQLTEDLDARIVQRSAGVVVQIDQATREQRMRETAAFTMAQAGRPTL